MTVGRRLIWPYSLAIYHLGSISQWTTAAAKKRGTTTNAPPPIESVLQQEVRLEKANRKPRFDLSNHHIDADLEMHDGTIDDCFVETFAKKGGNGHFGPGAQWGDDTALPAASG